MGSIAAESVPAVPDAEQTDGYELVLFSSSGTRILLQQENARLSLPIVRIPRFTRPAQQLTTILRNDWGITAVLLWSRRIETEKDLTYFAVLETISDIEDMPAGLSWFTIQVALSSLGSPQAALIESSYTKAFMVCFGADREPFSRIGWIHRLRDWINRAIRPQGIELGEFVQLNGSEAFSLVKFETSGKPVWFKAVGEPNQREFSITLLLSRLFPDYLPRILASDPALNGWLTESGGELTLFDCTRLKTWEDVVQRLAVLQIRSLGRHSQLLHSGCHDLRLETLNSLIPSFFDAMADLMLLQTRPSPPPLTVGDISALASDVKEALNTMAECSEAATLGHADFNPGNILVDREQGVFTDWAEAYVGSPFLTFEYFIAHLSNSYPRLKGREDPLRDAYTKPWLSLISAANLRRTLNVTKLVAPYAYAISCNAWRDPGRLADPRVQGSLRSLTRRMKREAEMVFHRREAHSIAANHYSA